MIGIHERRLNRLRASLGLEGASATTRLHSIGILEGKALLFETIKPVNGGSVEIQSTLLIDDDWNAVAFILAIGLVVVVVVKVQRVVEAAAATASDANSENHGLIEIMFSAETLYFYSCALGKLNCHLGINPFTRVVESGNVFIEGEEVPPNDDVISYSPVWNCGKSQNAHDS